MQLNTSRLRISASWLFAILALGSGVASTRAQAPVAKPPAVEEYRLGPGDIVSISVTDSPEFNQKARVSDSGVIQVTGVNDALTAEGLTPIELSQFIRKSLMEAKQLRDPKVNVFIDEYHGRTVTILGAVAKPSVYALTRRTNVLDAISLAGGPLPNSGNTVTVVRGEAGAEASGTAVGSVRIVDVGRLTRGEDPGGNIEVYNGDVLNVSPAQVVYVVGAVAKPGGYVMTNPSEGVSVVQAVALAEGFRPLAATHRGLIIRQSTSVQSRREIPVDIENVMTGTQADLVLAPNDILYVPESGRKKTLKVMGEIAMSAVNGVAIYGLGYRVGTTKF